MAQRDTSKKVRARRRRSAPAASATQGEAVEAGDVEDSLHLAARARDLETQCERLMAQLEAARQRISELERIHDLAVNRIDWVLDSLHNLVEQES